MTSYIDSEEDSDSEAWRQEMEIALYAQLHFEENTDCPTTEQPDIGTEVDIKVLENSPKGYKAIKTTSDLLLNRSIGQRDDSEDENPQCNKSLRNAKEKNRKLIDAILDRMDADFDDNADVEFQDLDSDIDSLYGVLDDDLMSDPGGIELNIKRNQRPLLESSIVEGDRWKINLDDIRQGRNIARYHKRFRCHNCNEEGHLSKNCPKPKKQKICGFCSNTGHQMLSCPESLCYNCDMPGHDARECPNRRRNLYTTCFRCKMQGHDQNKCPELWRQFHHTTTPGKIIRKKRKARSATYCYNCAGDDHLGHECDEDRMSKYVRVASPFVCQYDKSFDSHGDFDREGTEEPPAKRQATEAEVKKSKQLSSFIRGTNNPSSYTGRNNFDNLQFKNGKNINKKQIFNFKGKGKNVRNKDQQRNVAETVQSRNFQANQQVQKRNSNANQYMRQNEEIEDFPRGNKAVFKNPNGEDFPRGNKAVFKNPNGFRSRFIEMGANKSSPSGSNMRITVNCQQGNELFTGKRNDAHVRFTDSPKANFPWKRNNAHVRFTDSPEANKTKKQKKSKQFALETLEDSTEFTNHQVHNNEWWNKKKKASKSRKNKKKMEQKNSMDLL